MCQTAGCERPVKARGLCNTCYAARMRREIAYGRWEPYVDAGPVRAHINALRAAGISTKRLRQLSGASHTTIQAIITGRPVRGAAPTRRVLKDTADKILAVPIPDVDYLSVAPGRRVSALGTSRRLQALIAAGYPQRDLACRLGWQWGGYMGGIFAGTATHVTARRACEVAALFGQLQMVPGTDVKARARGRDNGWPLPLDWDEERIDDPAYVPRRSTPAVASRLAVAPEDREARRVMVARLSRVGLSASDIAVRLDVSKRTVERDRDVLGLVERTESVTDQESA